MLKNRCRAEATALGKQQGYDGRCRDIKEAIPGKAPVVRFKMPQEGRTIVKDLIKGAVVFENTIEETVFFIITQPSYPYTLYQPVSSAQ